MTYLANQISILEDQLENLLRQKAIQDEAEKVLTPEHKMAIQLHEMMCIWNHSDGCGWHYDIKNGIHNWNSDSHQSWLTTARKISTFCCQKKISTDDAIEMFKMFKSS